MLLCRAGTFERLAIPLAQVARLEKIPSSEVEWAAGRAAVQYRDRILPLLNLAEMLGGTALTAATLPVVVYQDQAFNFGLVVDEISDIVEETVGDAYPSSRPGVLGSAIVGGRVTDFLDIEAVGRWASLASQDSLEPLRRALARESSPSVASEVSP